MNEQAEFLKEGVSELNGLVEELDVLAELTSQELYVHLTLEGSVPALLHALQPLLAHPTHLKELRGSQVGEDMVHEGIARHPAQGGDTVMVEGVLTLDGDVVVVAHFELDGTVCGVVVEHVGWMGGGIHRARADRLVMLDNP